MLRSSISIGRFFGVDVRVHLSIPLLLVLSIGCSEYINGEPWRGIGLWAALFFAILVREIARAIAAVYVGLRLRALFLLPVGGVMAFAPRDRTADSIPGTKAVTATGPIANFVVGLLLFATAYSLDPHVSLLAQPWISTSYILRSFIWMQLLLGIVNLLPASAMPSRQMLRAAASTSKQPAPTERSAGSAFGLGTYLAIAVILLGVVFMNVIFIMLGAFMLLSAQLGTTQSLSSPEAESILVREVMLTEYTLLSTTDTLRDALNRTVHSMQEVFPVVRGDRLVGSVARQTIADRLLAEGDGYLQGIMTRSLQLANPTERLVDALRRAATLGASEFIPVVEDGAMLGILTPQSLSRAVQQIQLTRPVPEPRTQP
jgi:CBS domain-containing protein